MRPRHPVKLAVLVASACLVALAAQAQSPLPAAPAANTVPTQRFTIPPAELQRQFWRCDHAATREQLDFATAEHCSHVTEALRRRHFGDNFDAFLAWWRAHKAAEHAALDARTAAAAPIAPAPAAPPARPLDGAAPEQLKAAYLRCDRLASTDHFDSAAALACSIVFEALKAHVFGGSTEQFIAWMKQQQGSLAERARPGVRP